MNPKRTNKVPKRMQVFGWITFSASHPNIGPVIATIAPPIVNTKPNMDGDKSN